MVFFRHMAIESFLFFPLLFPVDFTTSTTLTIDSRFDAARLALGDNRTTNTVVRFTLARTVTFPDPVTNIREVNFVVTWVSYGQDGAGPPL